MIDGGPNSRPERRTALIDRELHRLNIDIAALSETRLSGEGSLQERNYTFFWKGREPGQPRQHGVGFAIRNRILEEYNEVPTGINERMMMYRLQTGKDKPINLLSAYAPTMQATEEIKEQFYGKLDELASQVPANESLIVLGDFNARVGRDHEAWNGIIGRHGTGKMNSNGELLLAFCAQHNLVITDTMFKHKDIYKGTWKHPRSGQWHAIDHIMVQKSDLNNTTQTRVYRGADCDTDHRLLVAKFKIKPNRRGHKTENASACRFNIPRFQDRKTRTIFRQEVTKALNTMQIDSEDRAENIWQGIRDRLKQAAKNILGSLPRKQNPDWFNENEETISGALEVKKLCHNKTLDRPNDRKAAEEYRKAKGNVQRITRQLKNKWFQEKAAEIQELADTHNSGAFYKAVNTIYGPARHTICPVKDEHGTLCKQEADIAERWRRYYCNLLNQSPSVDPEAIKMLPQYPKRVDLAECPTLEEVEQAMNKLKNGKAPGEDSLPAEIYKYGGGKLIRMIHKLFCRIWKEETVPNDYKDATVVNVYKQKGDRMDCTNYRGISLLCVGGKILARIITDRLSPITEAYLPESQAGFRPGRGTIDMIFTLRQIQEKIREQHSSLHAVFIDLKKAFDMVNRQALWQILGKFGCPPKLVNIIASFHTDNKVQVVVGRRITDKFEITNGVRQGCVMAPLLFNVFMTALLINVDRKLQDRGIQVRYRTDGGLHNLARLKSQKNVRNRFISELQYADDAVILGYSAEEVQRMVDVFVEAYQGLGMEVNSTKTKLLIMRYDAPANIDPTISVRGNAIETVEQFNYLGSLVSNNCSLDSEINQRIRSAGNAMFKLRRRVMDCRDLRSETKISVYKAVVLPILLYGNECWTLYRKHVRLLEKFHQRQLRRILRIKWQDYISNARVLEQAKCDSIERILARNQLRWTGHVLRMPDERLPKQVLFGEIGQGQRTSGGQAKRYKDMLHTTLKNAGIRSNWEELCKDRIQWRAATQQNKGLFGQQKRAGTGATQNTQMTCSECGRTIGSRIGMVSHVRAHRRQQ